MHRDWKALLVLLFGAAITIVAAWIGKWPSPLLWCGFIFSFVAAVITLCSENHERKVAGWLAFAIGCIMIAVALLEAMGLIVYIPMAVMTIVLPLMVGKIKHRLY